ncbi:hypothetical protein OK016_22980 [Vibrio chagasii]|nr:hypothetical protein [Vibrio chagasii]
MPIDETASCNPWRTDTLCENFTENGVRNGCKAAFSIKNKLTLMFVVHYLRRGDDSNLYHWQATVERNFTVLSGNIRVPLQVMFPLRKWIEGRDNVVIRRKTRSNTRTIQKAISPKVLTQVDSKLRMLDFPDGRFHRCRFARTRRL